MKFEFARTRQQQADLHLFFESCTILRNADTRQSVFLFRPGRLLALVVMLGAFLPIAVVLTAVLWAQQLVPEAGLTFTDAVYPWRWPHLLDEWRQPVINYPDGSMSSLPRSKTPEFAPRPASAARPAPAPAPEAKPPGAPTRSPSIYTMNNHGPASAVSYGPIMWDYLSHNGGLDKLQDVRGLQVQGNVTMANGSVLNFTMVKRPPDKIRLTMRAGPAQEEATVLANGDRGWRWVGAAGAQAPESLGPEQLKAIEREALYCGVIFELINSPHTLREIAHVSDDQDEYNRVLGTLPNNMRVEVLIDPDTQRADRIQIQYDENGVPCLYVIQVKEWMTVNGVDEPSHFEVFVNGGKLLDGKINQVTYNAGVLDVMFEPPAAAKPAAAAGESAPAAIPAPGAN